MSHPSGDWKGHPVWSIYRFRDEDGKVAAFTQAGSNATLAQKLFADRLVSSTVAEGNLLLNGGITIMWSNIGTTGTQFNAANSRLGVGTDGTGANATQTQLNPSVPGSVYYQVADATYPQISGQTIIYQATFPSTAANFLWQEFGVDNDAVDGNGSSIAHYSPGVIGLMNRLVVSQGTKVASQTWILQLSIALS